MYELRRFGMILGLSIIRNMLKGLGHPQNQYSSIHVAGTNGKGSVAASLSSILHKAGYRVGLFTSPHLVRFNERICINNSPISDDQVVSAYLAVKETYKGKRQPTFFEYSTAMALHEFSRRKVDWAIIETGMGGRLDATNVIKPTLAIITNISMEHRMHLGNTLADIAGEKAGIIKRNVPVITGTEQKHAKSVIEAAARTKSAPFYGYGDSFKARRTPGDTFSYYGREHVWKGLKSGLSGPHQIRNAALVLAACECLMQKKVSLTLEQIKSGLLDTKWPGRLEIVQQRPLVILDGAHNFMAARALKKHLTQALKDRKITMVIGILDDKPYQAMLKSLLPGCHRVIVTKARIDRALPVETLYEAARRHVSNTKIIPDVADALNYAIKTTHKKDAVCVAGSLYVVGEAKEAIEAGNQRQ
ncbi:MAG TPA: bifunctional folylpolyglutamate synthase/dihydrofolate synthase [Deltaproteobacteria bacterium]|nr:bifunctional folylpolyglutamate synthase/dihydrofolate synthase [Deltaproteobacteria bacterium]